MLAAILQSLDSQVFAQQESITQDPVTGFYDVTYLVEGDTLHIDTFFPGNLVDPAVTVSVTPDPASSSLVYHYSVENREGAHDRMGLFAWAVELRAELDTVLVPNSEWRTGVMTDRFAGYPALGWAHTQGSVGTGIPSDSIVTGFLYVSDGLPFIAEAHGRSESLVNWKDEGPFGQIAAQFDSLEWATRLVPLTTIGAKVPPIPFNLNNFLDTLATYSLRAAAEGWIADTTAADLDALLNDATSALDAGDSTWAATLLGTVLNHVEVVKDDSLSSEGYALMKYNIEHALEYLPPVVEVRLFLEGAYSSGQLSQTALGHVPTQQPFHDSLSWDYAGLEAVSRVPGFAVDWVVVGGIAPDSQAVGRTAGLLSKYGVAMIAPVSGPPDSMYVVVDHRNHIPIMSDALVDMTGGYAEHDFTTGHAYGNKPQRLKIVGQDSVYLMFAGDGNVDRQTTAPDFNLWNAATAAGATGYLPSDYNLDGQATAPDFNLWYANTSAGAASQIPEFAKCALYPNDPTCVESESLALTEGPGSYVRLNVTKDTGNEFWVRIEAKADTSQAPNDTFGSATIDVNYDDSELTPSSVQGGVLGTGYSVGVSDIGDEEGAYLRLKVTSSSIGTGFGEVLGHSLDTDWEVLRELRFTRTPPPGDDGTAIRMGSLSIGFYDSPSNENGTWVIIASEVEVE